MWMLLLDVNRFKHINDTYSHCTGDYVLFTIADLMQCNLPQNEGWVVSHLDGDEFLVLLPDCSERGITAALKKLLGEITSYDSSDEEVCEILINEYGLSREQVIRFITIILQNLLILYTVFQAARRKVILTPIKQKNCTSVVIR